MAAAQTSELQVLNEVGPEGVPHSVEGEEGSEEKKQEKCGEAGGRDTSQGSGAGTSCKALPEETNINAIEKDTEPDQPKAPQEELIERRFRHLAQSFRDRTARVRKRFDLPPTPSTVSSEPEEINTRISAEEERQLMASMSKEWTPEPEGDESRSMVEPQSCLYVTWLSVVTLSYLYNCFVIPLRITFPYQSKDNTPTWLALDLSMDCIYLLDIVLVKPRVMYLDGGFWVRDPKRTWDNYVQKSEFIVDVLSLTPLDLLYFYFGPNFPILRVPRLLKIPSFWEFFNHFDKFSPSPYIVRIARTLTYMIYLVHLNACAYYWVSENEGINSNHWVFNGVGNAYIRCFYFAVKTATSIGKNPRPENEVEYLFMTVSWLMGVFVFAILIGQIRDIIATATRSQTEYRKLMDETLHHLRKLNLPQRQIERVKTWFSYTWEQQHTLDEARVLDTLPHKMKTDVAINVHISTLNKVQLFKDCDEALLRELVLKLRPVLYLPGDYICRKGEVGREMYIVKSGQVQVVTGEDGTEVLATLTEGSVFGEISLLQVSGGNRRTADVRSNGFSNLFVLNKDDLNEALKFHPNAQEILRKKARQLVKQNAAREKLNRVKAEEAAEVLIGNPEPGPRQPKLLPIVMKVLPPESGSARLLKYGSRWGRKRRLNTTNSAASAPQSATKKRRCNSIELGYLGRGGSLLGRAKPTENTFQCSVTVHREMSK